MKINKNLVIFSEKKYSNKFSVLRKLCSLLFENGIISSEESFYKVIESRENDMTTGFGYGLAIPHGRTAKVNFFDFAIIFLKNGIEYDAIDGKPVKIIFLAAIPEKEGNSYQKKLSLISSFFRDEKNRNEITNVKNKDELIQILERI